MDNKITRKTFLKKASILTLGFTGLGNYLLSQSMNSLSNLSYNLVKDPKGIINLPPGFEYKIVSQFKNKMNDGLQVPDHADGMGCFKIDQDRVALIRNHELGRFEEFNFKGEHKKSAFPNTNNLSEYYSKELIYDNCKDGISCFGGTTTTIYNIKNYNVENEYLSLAGTLINCSGGVTPWGTWITCEETVAKKNNFLLKDHGYNFEVIPNKNRILSNANPLKSMGRFRHEAVAFHNGERGSVYQTEDRTNGLIYRFLPNDKTKLLNGGKLQALSFLDELSLDTRNWGKKKIKQGESYSIKWLDLEDVESPNDDLREQGYKRGCAMFARPEGMWEYNGKIYFTCTSGGKKQLGQIWEYTPSAYEGFTNEERNPAKLKLFFESDEAKSLDMCDNITISPLGDIIICEDGGGTDRLIGIKQDGQSYKIAKNILNNSEFAGACFSPDGKILFVNIYKPTITLAITGDWNNLSSAY
tara:strand:+ start:1231 stop:2643 length:1413 start_codon:yes stop_codon:yes gene_type:complete